MIPLMNSENSTNLMLHALPDTSGPQRRVTVNCLPLDILVIILQDVFQSVRRPDISRQLSMEWNAVRLHPWPSTDLHNPASLVVDDAGAECLAVVHPLWREAMSLLTTFWTSLVIWIGRDPTPLSRVREYLAWSQDELLDIYVLRRYDPSVHDSTEKAQVSAIVELLSHHMPRCKLLYMSTLHPTSLPRPRLELVGHAHGLLGLHLRSILDTGPPTDPPGFSPTYEHFVTPVLSSLSMGGAHFRDAYVKPFPRLHPPQELEFLALVDYDPSFGSFSVRELLSCIVTCKKVIKAHFENLQLDGSCSGPPLPEIDSLIWWDPDLVWVDMSGEIIAEHSRLLSFPSAGCATYRRCTAIPRHSSPPRAAGIMFEEIDDPNVLLSYLAPRPSIVPIAIHLSGCEGLSSAVFRALAMPFDNSTGDSDEESETWLCPNLMHVFINECTNFHSKDLRMFLQARYTVHEATDWVDEHDPEFIVSSITGVTVTGGPELDPDERECLKALCSNISWNGRDVHRMS